MAAADAPPRIHYMPQLDGLRAVAVTCVVAGHYGINSTLGFDIGQPMVRLFFVLSGFLITSILLNYRRNNIADGHSPWPSAVTFWKRRALRIFPIYYLTLAVACVAGMGAIADHYPFHFLYLSNFLFAERGWEPGFSHFWSLAVEEQFYLVWPFAVLLMPRRALLVVTVTLFAAAPLSRLYLAAHGDTVAALVYPVACFDTLLAGALLAQLQGTRFEGALLQWGKRLGALGLVFYFHCKFSGYAVLALTVKDLAFGGVFLYWTAAARSDIPGVLGCCLSNAAVRYIGKVSYGIYVYHNFVPYFMPSLCRAIGVSVPDSGLIRGALYGAVTLAVAVVSWIAIERPLLRLKDRCSVVPESADSARFRWLSPTTWKLAKHTTP